MLGFTGTRRGGRSGMRDSRIAAFEAIDAVYAEQQRANIAALRERERRKQHGHPLKELVKYWPVAAGIVLSIFAPRLMELVAPYQPWGKWIVFPFVAILERPEVRLDGAAAGLLPSLMLYVQFPLEGRLAMIALKGKVTIGGVVGQVLIYHFLGVAELFLVNNALGHFSGR